MNIKERLIEKISHIQDEAILDEIMEIVELELELTRGDEIKLTRDQKKFIDEGLDDVKSGNLITNDEARKITKERLKKK